MAMQKMLPNFGDVFNFTSAFSPFCLRSFILLSNWALQYYKYPKSERSRILEGRCSFSTFWPDVSWNQRHYIS
jgi:hypothetical protein